MSSKKRGYVFYLEDMLESMQRILDYTQDLSFDEFKASELITDAVIRNLEIIGEASKNVPDSVKSTHSEMPWTQMYGLRNLVIHEYFGIDYENIWKIIQEDLSINIRDLQKIIEQERKRKN